MQTTREKIHAQIRSNVITSEPWRIGFDSSYKRSYFVYNVNGGYALTKTGQTRRFATQDTASAVADKMNLEDQQRRRESEANQNVLRHAEVLRHGPGRTFEQAELEDEINNNEGCSVRVWSDDGIGKTKRLHIHDPRGTEILKNVIVSTSNTQIFEAQIETLEEECRTILACREDEDGIRFSTDNEREALIMALETALEMLGKSELLEEN